MGRMKDSILDKGTLKDKQDDIQLDDIVFDETLDFDGLPNEIKEEIFEIEKEEQRQYDEKMNSRQKELDEVNAKLERVKNNLIKEANKNFEELNFKNFEIMRNQLLYERKKIIEKWEWDLYGGW